ncbi:MAG TPA: response regulator [Nitrospiraceae bacterium]|nr:response regulator [Nitrospiraceae bacterium]
MIPFRLLIIDDDARVLQVLSRIVTHQLHNVLVDTAPGAQTALRLLKATNYDTVLTDFMMPEMTGASLIRRIRELGLSTPIILMSGILNLSERDPSSDVFAYLSKPIDHRVLINTLSRSMSHARTYRQSIGRLNNTELLVYAHCYGD